MTPTVELRHNRVCLALHQLRDGGGRPLLLLHGLGERTPDEPPTYVDTWAGPVFGLDFTGHGASTKPRGGGYTAEILMGDVDAALAHLGAVTILGRGLGAYIGLLAAGARADMVRGVVLADGPGLGRWWCPTGERVCADGQRRRRLRNAGSVRVVRTLARCASARLRAGVRATDHAVVGTRSSDRRVAR